MMSVNIAPSPLFRDPIYDCPTDPTVIYNHLENCWYLFYTQRRATDPKIGVSWIHGTKLAVASSVDGLKWLYRGTIEDLDFENGHNTFWAPEIIYELGSYHMFVSYITGIPTDWNYPRSIVHYQSDDLWDWTYIGVLDLGSERVIDACVHQVADSRYKMWYKDESNGSLTCAAESKDLKRWDVLGPEITDYAQEGPNVFDFLGRKWLISDFWDGLAVYKSDDYKNWVRNGTILSKSGKRVLDQGQAHHADVLILNDRAYIIYFNHPFIDPNIDLSTQRFASSNRAVIQVAELEVENEKLICDRNKVVEIKWFHDGINQL